MKASEIMSHPVVTVTPTTAVRNAAAMLAERGITSMPVVDEDDHLIGIVSELDLIRDRVAHDPRRLLSRRDGDAPDPPNQVGQVMSPGAICLPDFTDAADVAQAMVENNVRAIPITDGVRVVGIVSRGDLLRTLLRDDVAIHDEVLSRLCLYAGEVDRWKVEVEEGVVNIHGRFEDDHQRHVVTTLAATVPGVVRAHIRPKWFG